MGRDHTGISWTSLGLTFAAIILLHKGIAAAGPDSAADPRPGTVPGALASYDFEDGAGDTLRDRSGNGRHGFIQGAQWTKGYAGGGLEFDGTDWVRIPGDSALAATSFTVSVWMMQSGNGVRAPLFEFHPLHDLVGVCLWANTSGFKVDVPGAFYANLRPDDATAQMPSSVRERNTLMSGAGTAPGGRWNHVVLTFDSAASQARLYVNGQLAVRRVLAPFRPRTRGDLWLGMRTPTSIEWDAGVGLKGVLDQVDIYGRALGEAEVKALYNRPRTEPGPLHLGIKTHYAKAGDTLWVPVYLTSDGEDSLSSLKFDLELDTAVAELLAVAVDTAIAPGWEALDWSRGRRSPVTLALAGTRRITGVEEGELLRLKYRVREEARTGASTMLTLARLSADEGRRAALTHGPGRIFVISPDVLYGDVTGDGEVDIADAQGILRHVVGDLSLPDPRFPNFTVAVADVSGNGEITGYDAALVLQWGLGVISEFPAAHKGLAKSTGRAAAARLTLQAPEPVPETGTLRYRLTGASLSGFIGGELTFEAGSGLASVARVAALHPGLRVTHRWNAAARRLEVAFAGNRGLKDPEAVLLEVEVTPTPGAVPSLSLDAAVLNEGAVEAGSLLNERVESRAAAGAGPRKGVLAVALGNAWRIALAEGPMAALEAYDARGSRILVRRFQPVVTEAVLARDDLPVGLVHLRVRGDTGWQPRILPPLTP